jgi:hypothetical protein
MPPITAVAPAQFYSPDRNFKTQWSEVTSCFDQALWSRSANRKLDALQECVSAETIKIGRSILVDLAKLRMPAPAIVPVSGGGIQFEWSKSEVELEIEILPDQTIEYLVTESNATMTEGPVESHNGIAELAGLTSWFLSGGKLDDRIGEYAGT